MENTENRQNSAVEKVETVSAPANGKAQTAGQTKGRAKATTSAAKKSNVKISSKGTQTKKTAKKSLSPAAVKAKKEQERAAKFDAREERKAERTRLKEERKLAREEAARVKRLAKEERKAAHAAAKLEKKEARIARRDMLKAESRDERKARIASERAEKIRLRREKAELRAKLLSEKRENRRILKQQKRELRAASRSERRSRGIGGWLAAVISLGCATLLLATLYTFNMFYMSGGNELLENLYRRSYYDLESAVDNIDVNLSKLSVSSSPAHSKKILTDIIIQSELAEDRLQSLPLEDEARYSTGKYINQLGDFSKSLSQRLDEGGEMTDKDRETVAEFYRRNTELQKALRQIDEGMGEDFSFLSLLRPDEGNAVLSSMRELENISASYPKMIYDGPFSDAEETETSPKGLVGGEVKRKDILKKFRELFSSYSVDDAEVVGESGGYIPTYNIEATLESGSTVYAQMTKTGGRLILFNCYEPCEKENFTMDECREIAESFVIKAGFEGMKPVWETSSRAVASFNFAYSEGGIPVYSDLIKVNVCMERGLVSAIEAEAYFLNHTERDVPEAVLSADDAREKVNGIEISSVRKAIVPVGKTERLAYEVAGQAGGSLYYIYIDASDGKELEIFKVIESTEGRLII